MNNTKTEMVKPSDVRHNDTLVIDGHYCTIGREDISYNDFTGEFMIMGIRAKLVERVLFRKWYKGKVIDWRTQI